MNALKPRRALGVLTAVAGATILSLTGATAAVAAPMPLASVVVPDVVGDQVNVAISTLNSVGLTATVATFVDNFCNFTWFEVTREVPGAGSTVEVGSSVRISVPIPPTHPCP